MKKLFQLSLAVLTLLTAWPARAWTYNEGDVLLIFRESAIPSTYPSPNNDVEFDIGSVTNFLGKTNGYTRTVTGWALSQVQAVYGSDLTGVSVILIAATSPTNASPTAYFSAALPQSFWLNGVEPYKTAYNVSPSVWQGFWTKINSIGTRPALYLPAAQQTAAYSFSPSSILSYDAIVSSGVKGVSGLPLAAGSQQTVYQDWLPQFGGSAPFTVEGVAPGSFGFLAVAPSTAADKPLDSYIGTFTIDNLGNLTFTAGPPTPVVTGITRAGNVNTVSFTTGLSGNYSLAYTNKLGGPTNWPVVGGSLVGDGNTNSLNYTSADTAGFFKVVRTP
jgi:hypothetical protein